MIVTAIFVWIDRRWVRDPDGWDPRTVNAMGPDIDVSTLDGLAVQLLGKEYTRSVSVAASVLEIGVLADRVDGGPEHRPAGTDRVHGARAGMERRLLGRRSR